MIFQPIILQGNCALLINSTRSTKKDNFSYFLRTIYDADSSCSVPLKAPDKQKKVMIVSHQASFIFNAELFILLL